MRKGAPKPDISSAVAFKRALLAAKAVAYPGKAPADFISSACSTARHQAEMQGKLKPMAAEDTVGEVVARGEADMVVVVATRITGVPASIWSGRFGGPADQDRFCGRLERLREGT